MKKKRNMKYPILVLILVLVMACLTGCKKKPEEQAGGTVAISIVDVSVTEPDQDGSDQEEPASSPDVQTAEEPETDQGDQPSEEPAADPGVQQTETPKADQETVDYYFRNAKLLGQHYEKHGIEMGFASEEEYEAAASAVINNPNALHKVEKEDGDDIFYIEETNDFVVLSKDGYIRTYFWPSAGIKYFNRQ